MKFLFKECIQTALIQAVGSRPDPEIRLAAVKWAEKGVLTQADLTELDAAIAAQAPEEGAK